MSNCVQDAQSKADYAAVYIAEEANVDSISPMASNITWDDDYFAGEEDVIAVFDFDYEKIESFNLKVGYAVMLFPPFAIMASFALVPCFLHKQVKWDAYSQHLCITQDGIRYVREKRPTMCGLPCTDAGKSSKTVPFDKITDCDIEEPAGNTCFCVENILSTVNVDTASSGASSDGIIRHELALRGLKDPHSFKKLVWAMKRSNGSTYTANVMKNSPSAQVINRSSGLDDKNVPLLLEEIRDELREQNRLLKFQADLKPNEKLEMKSDNIS